MPACGDGKPGRGLRGPRRGNPGLIRRDSTSECHCGRLHVALGHKPSLVSWFYFFSNVALVFLLSDDFLSALGSVVQGVVNCLTKKISYLMLQMLPGSLCSITPGLFQKRYFPIWIKNTSTHTFHNQSYLAGQGGFKISQLIKEGCLEPLLCVCMIESAKGF